MRYTLLFLLLLVVCCHSADRAKTPAPIKPDRQESISRAMLRFQQSRLNFILGAANGVDPANAVSLQQEVQKSAEAYQTLLAQLQKEYDAPNCQITFDKQWECPKPTNAK